MSTDRDYRDYLQDMLEAADKVALFIQGMTEEQFLADEKTQYAVVRALEVIGEAAKKVPMALRSEHPGLPWRQIVGMRDKLIHDYFGVNRVVVWRTAREDVPRCAKEDPGIGRSIPRGSSQSPSMLCWFAAARHLARADAAQWAVTARE